MREQFLVRQKMPEGTKIRKRSCALIHENAETAAAGAGDGTNKFLMGAMNSGQ